MDFVKPLEFNYQYGNECLSKFQDVMDLSDIKDSHTRMATAMCMNNTIMESDKGVTPEFRSQMLNESFAGTVNSLGTMGAGPSTVDGGGALGTATNYGPGDSRVPQAILPIFRRFFPELIAHDWCGVQPMGGPVGFALALRYVYGDNGQGQASGTVSKGLEMGYRTVDARFTGQSGLLEQDTSALYGSQTTGINGQLVPGVGTTTSAAAAWQAFGTDLGNGRGADLSNAEFWKVGEDMPMAGMRIEKAMVEAQERKIATATSLELLEDVKSMFSFDAMGAMIDGMAQEMKQQIDRELLGDMVKACIVGDAADAGRYISNWSPVSADGRQQFERIGTLYTQILSKSQQIALNTRQGAANRLAASPQVIALLQRLYDMTGFQAAADSTANMNMNAGGTIAKVGMLNQGAINVYRDSFAAGDYILLGYKGNTPMEAGVIYCPYVPFQVMKAQNPQTFAPVSGVRTRYGKVANLFGSANYHQFITVSGLTNTLLAGDSGRVFLY